MHTKKQHQPFGAEVFKAIAMADMKAEKDLIEKGSFFTPLMGELLEAALGGEMASHAANWLEVIVKFDKHFLENIV